MAFIIHELAINTEAQEKLSKEIQEHDARHKGQADYNSIQSMEYLDMVVSGEDILLFSIFIGNILGLSKTI